MLAVGMLLKKFIVKDLMIPPPLPWKMWKFSQILKSTKKTSGPHFPKKDRDIRQFRSIRRKLHVDPNAYPR